MKKFLDIAGTVMIGGTWIDIEEFTGRSVRTIKNKHLDPLDKKLFHVDSYNAETNDLACDPRSGGIAGWNVLAEIYEVSVQQLKRNILRQRGYAKWLFGEIPVTNVNSAVADAAVYREEVKNMWAGNFLGHQTNCSSDYT